MKTTIKELLKELDVAVNQNYDSDYLKDVIGALDYKIDLLGKRLEQLDEVVCSMLGEILKNNKNFKIKRYD